MKAIKSPRGFTLVEIIVSLAILVIVCAMFVMVVNGTFGLVKRGADLKEQGAEATNIMENINNNNFTDGSSLLKEESGVLSFYGDNAAVSGSYKTVTVGDVTFKVFIPN